MGARKKISAEKRKEALKTMYFAKLQNVPTSPRKMRLVADMIRGMEVNLSLIHILSSLSRNSVFIRAIVLRNCLICAGFSRGEIAWLITVWL